MNIPHPIRLGNACSAEQLLSPCGGHLGLNTTTVHSREVVFTCWSLLQPGVQPGVFFANAKHKKGLEEWFPAVAALTCGVQWSIYAPSEVSHRCAHPCSPVPPTESTQQRCLLMASRQQGCSITFVRQQPLAGRQQQQVDAQGCPSTARGWLSSASRL